MNPLKRVFLVCGFLFLARPALSNSLSFTGSLATPETPFEVTFSLPVPSDIGIQTWGFGGSAGGTRAKNAAGMVILPGGFDPLVSLFTGPAATASILMVGGVPAVSADNLFGLPPNFTPACPPGTTVNIGTGVGSAVCGDATLNLTGLAAGLYTLVLTDANYVPFAVSPGPPTSSLLSDGFGDLTGGVFQTCNVTSNGLFCITPTSNFAVDVTSSSAVSTVPEPGTLMLLASGLVVLLCKGRRSLRRGGSRAAHRR